MADIISCEILFLCSEWYDHQSVMLSEEGVVISGLLMGLNAIDYNVLQKAEDFDKSVSLSLESGSRFEVIVCRLACWISASI